MGIIGFFSSFLDSPGAYKSATFSLLSLNVVLISVAAFRDPDNWPMDPSGDTFALHPFFMSVAYLVFMSAGILLKKVEWLRFREDKKSRASMAVIKYHFQVPCTYNRLC